MCIFCKIVNNEIPSYKIYEDDNFLAFLALGPDAKGHTLVIPKEHYADIFELPEDCKIFSVVTKLSKYIKLAMNAEGVNILNNSGEAAGQTINHFHIHIIPRFKGDGIITNTPNIELSDEEYITIAQQIKSKIKN